MIANPKFVVFAAVLGLVLVEGNNTTQTQTVNITVFAVEMGASVTIWQNDKRTDQTFFMDGTLDQLGAMYRHRLSNLIGEGIPFPFLHNFTINNHTFVVPTTGVYNFGELAAVKGAIRSNFYYGLLQFIKGTPSQWELYSSNMTSQLDDYMITGFAQLFS